MVATIAVKCRLDDDIRRFSLPASADFDELFARVVATYTLKDALFVIKYTDDEGDAVTIANNDDLLEAFRQLAPGSAARLRLIVCLEKKKPAQPVLVAAPVAAASIGAPAPGLPLREAAAAQGPMHPMHLHHPHHHRMRGPFGGRGSFGGRGPFGLFGGGGRGCRRHGWEAPTTAPVRPATTAPARPATTAPARPDSSSSAAPAGPAEAATIAKCKRCEFAAHPGMDHGYCCHCCAGGKKPGQHGPACKQQLLPASVAGQSVATTAADKSAAPATATAGQCCRPGCEIAAHKNPSMGGYCCGRCAKGKSGHGAWCAKPSSVEDSAESNGEGGEFSSAKTCANAHCNEPANTRREDGYCCKMCLLGRGHGRHCAHGPTVNIMGRPPCQDFSGINRSVALAKCARCDMTAHPGRRHGFCCGRCAAGKEGHNPHCREFDPSKVTAEVQQTNAWRIHSVGQGANAPAKFLARFIGHGPLGECPTMAPSEAFTKEWALRNDTPVPWPEAGVALQYVSGRGGDSFGLPLSVPIDTHIAPGAEGIVAVSARAPARLGLHEGYWRLTSADGGKFGQRLKMAALVQDQPERPIDPSKANNDSAAITADGEEEAPSEGFEKAPPPAVDESQSLSSGDDSDDAFEMVDDDKEVEE